MIFIDVRVWHVLTKFGLGAHKPFMKWVPNFSELTRSSWEHGPWWILGHNHIMQLLIRDLSGPTWASPIFRHQSAQDDSAEIVRRTPPTCRWKSNYFHVGQCGYDSCGLRLGRSLYWSFLQQTSRHHWAQQDNWSLDNRAVILGTHNLNGMVLDDQTFWHI